MLLHRLDAFHLIVFLCANVSGPPHSDRSLSLLRLKPMRNSKTTFSAFCVLFRRLHFFWLLFFPLYSIIFQLRFCTMLLLCFLFCYSEINIQCSHRICIKIPLNRILAEIKGKHTLHRYNEEKKRTNR